MQAMLRFVMQECYVAIILQHEINIKLDLEEAVWHCTVGPLQFMLDGVLPWCYIDSLPSDLVLA